MIILQYLVFIILSLVASCAAVVFRWNYLKKDKLKIGNILVKEKKILILFVVSYVAIACIGVFVFNKRNLIPPIVGEYIIFWWAAVLCAVIDYKEKKIPNAIVLFTIIVRVIGIVIECINKKHIVTDIILSSLIGLFIGGFIMLVCMFISRGGVGAGDVKFFAAIGLYYGLAGVISIMMMTLFFAAIVSIVLLLSKKAKMKSTIAMAPFILLGLSLHNILS